MNEYAVITVHEDYMKLSVDLLVEKRDAELLREHNVIFFADLHGRQWEKVLCGERLESSRCRGLVRRTSIYAAPVEELFEQIFINIANRSLHHGYHVFRLQLLNQLSLRVIASEEWQATGFTCPTTIVRIRQCLSWFEITLQRYLLLLEAVLASRDFFVGRTAIKIGELEWLFGSRTTAKIVIDGFRMKQNGGHVFYVDEDTLGVRD